MLGPFTKRGTHRVVQAFGGEVTCLGRLSLSPGGPPRRNIPEGTCLEGNLIYGKERGLGWK